MLESLKYTLIAMLYLSIICSSCDTKSKEVVAVVENVAEAIPENLLRHVVLFEFNEKATEDIVHNIEEEFAGLPKKISVIHSYEWGVNNSPEGLSHGLTHCFFVTFLSEEDRAIYLPHPAHKRFVEYIGPYVESVTVVDYWTSSVE